MSTVIDVGRFLSARELARMKALVGEGDARLAAFSAAAAVDLLERWEADQLSPSSPEKAL